MVAADHVEGQVTLLQHGIDHPIGELWREERSRLQPLPAYPYPCCRTVAVQATRQNVVRFERNRSSVPSRYADERLLRRPIPGTLRSALALAAGEAGRGVR